MVMRWRERIRSAADEADRIIEQQSDDIEALRSRLASAEKERDSWRDDALRQNARIFELRARIKELEASKEDRDG